MYALRRPFRAGLAALSGRLGGRTPEAAPVAVKLWIPAPSATASAPAATTADVPAAAAAAPRVDLPRTAFLPAAPSEPAPGWKRLYGVVFDLRSLGPVASAQVRISPQGEVVRTDADGRYQIDFNPPPPNLPRMTVAVVAAGYRPGQLEDPDPSYLMRTEKDRLEVAAQLSPVDLEEVPVRARDEETVVPLNLVLVPESAPSGK